MPRDAATGGAHPAGRRRWCRQRDVGDDAEQPGGGAGTTHSLSQPARVRRVVSEREIHLRPDASPQLHAGVPERAVLGRDGAQPRGLGRAGGHHGRLLRSDLVPFTDKGSVSAIDPALSLHTADNAPYLALGVDT